MSNIIVSDSELKVEALTGQSIKLTDARRVGLMLRDRYLTLREHSALTTLVAEAITPSTFKLKVIAIGGHNYIRVDGDKFKADVDASNAAQFSAKVTELGWELYYNGYRPAIFDRYHDVAIGPWTATSERSQTPILLWIGSLAEIWRST